MQVAVAYLGGKLRLDTASHYAEKILTESDEFIHEIPPFTGQKKVNKDILIVKRAGTRFENFNEMLTSNNTRKDILYFKLHL